MRWKAVALVFAIGLCATSAYIMASRRTPEPVFRDLAWGDPPSKLGKFREALGTVDNCRVYIRRDDSFFMHQAKLDVFPFYGFLDDEFVFVSLRGDYDTLKQVADAKYGRPTLSEGALVWRTKNLICVLSNDDAPVLTIVNRDYAEQLTAHELRQLRGIW